MRRIGEIYLEWPFYGSRKLCESLRNEGTVVNRKHMQRLMRLMGLESVAPKPDTSKPHPEHPVFLYLGHYPAESVVADGHHVHPDGTRLRVLGGHHRLVQSPRPRVAPVQTRCRVGVVWGEGHAAGLRLLDVRAAGFVGAIGDARSIGGGLLAIDGTGRERDAAACGVRFEPRTGGARRRGFAASFVRRNQRCTQAVGAQRRLAVHALPEAHCRVRRQLATRVGRRKVAEATVVGRRRGGRAKALQLPAVVVPITRRERRSRHDHGHHSKVARSSARVRYARAILRNDVVDRVLARRLIQALVGVGRPNRVAVGAELVNLPPPPVVKASGPAANALTTG